MILIHGIQEITHRYEIFIFDLWGVVHDGITPFQSSIEAMKRLKSLDKTVLILSNSPKRVTSTADHLCSMGIERDLYDGIYTSGEDCYDRLRLRDHAWYQALGKNLFHIGPERNLPTFDGLGYVIAQTPQQADFVLCSGTDGWCKTLDPFYTLLEHCLDSNLPMVCANADMGIQRQGIEYICVGKMAQYYENRGGNVFYHGKPSQAMFDRLMTQNAIMTPKNKILMIGDSLRTDIPGAHSFGIDSLWIASGIHWNEPIHEALFQRFNAFPTWMMQWCTW